MNVEKQGYHDKIAWSSGKTPDPWFKVVSTDLSTRKTDMNLQPTPRNYPEQWVVEIPLEEVVTGIKYTVAPRADVMELLHGKLRRTAG